MVLYWRRYGRAGGCRIYKKRKRDAAVQKKRALQGEGAEEGRSSESIRGQYIRKPGVATADGQPGQQEETGRCPLYLEKSIQKQKRHQQTNRNQNIGIL